MRCMNSQDVAGAMIDLLERAKQSKRLGCILNKQYLYIYIISKDLL